MSGAVLEAPIPVEAAPPPRGRDDVRRLSRALTILLLVVAAAECWVNRHTIFPDGISYLDVGEAWWRGDWDHAINGYWSPLYSWLAGGALRLTGVSRFDELLVVQALNLAIFAIALAAFSAFLRELLRHRTGALLGDRALVALGYAVFAWAELELIRVGGVFPDAIVSAVVFAAVALVLRIDRRGGSLGAMAALGALVGVGFLAKAAMLPVGAVFVLAGAWVGFGVSRRAVWGAIVAGLAVAAVAGPFVLALSLDKGRPTTGESGKVNYAWAVNGVPAYVGWQGQTRGAGQPVHAPRALWRSPLTVSYAGPVGGSVPAWYDASYWYEGVQTHFEPAGQVRIVRETLGDYARIVAGVPALALFLLLAVLWWATRARPRWGSVRTHAYLLPPLAAIAMYGAVHVLPRYVAAYIAVLVLAAFASLRPGAPSLRPVALGAVALVVAALLALPTARAAYHVGKQVVSADARAQPQRDVAVGLREAGVRPGDRVAFVGDRLGPLYAYWARLAGVRIEGQVLDARAYWRLPSGQRARLDGRLAAAGARVLVSDAAPPRGRSSGWGRLGRSPAWARFLAAPSTP